MLAGSYVRCVCSRRRTTIEWAESHNFPPFSQAKMEDTRFVDLKVKVGFPYLYCHQGDCEHLVIITDIRSTHVLLQVFLLENLLLPHSEQTEKLDLIIYAAVPNP